MISAAMSDDRFWALIAQSHPFGGKQSERMLGILERLPNQEKLGYYVKFYELYWALYHWDVWGAAYVYDGGCSEDSFMDFRAGVIAHGRQTYQRIVENPDALAQFDPNKDQEYLFFESFLYVAQKVLEKAGLEVPTEVHQGHENPTGEDWDPEDAEETKRRLPACYAAFWEE